MSSEYHIQHYFTSFLIFLVLISLSCNGLKRSGEPVKRGPHQDAAENSEELRERIAEYEKQFYGQVELAYKLFSQEMPVPVAELAGSDEIHIEFALSSREFWQKLRTEFTEIGRDTRSDFTDQFITLPHQGGVRVGFVDLVRAKAIWNALRGDTQTDLVMALDVPLIPDRVEHENPEQYPAKKRLKNEGDSAVYHSPPFTIIPKGNVLDVQGARFADGSLRFARFDIHFPDLRQEGQRNIRTTRSGSLRQIKTVTWRESPKVRRNELSLSQLVLPKGVAMIALVPADCLEISQSSEWIPITYVPERNWVPTSMILLVLPKRAAEAFAEKTP